MILHHHNTENNFMPSKEYCLLHNEKIFLIMKLNGKMVLDHQNHFIICKDVG